LYVIVVLKKKVDNLQRSSNGSKKELLELKSKHKIELLKTALTYQERERRRVASDIHDDVSSTLTAARRNLEMVLADRTADHNYLQIEETKKLLENAIESSRRIAQNLTPSCIETVGLVASVQDLANRLNMKGLRVTFSEIGFSERLKSGRDLLIYRVIQEILNNQVKHSGCSALSIQMVGGPVMTISIVDNGKPYKFLKDNTVGTGLGILSIQNRLELLDARIESESGPPSNVLEIFIPMKVVPNSFFITDPI